MSEPLSVKRYVARETAISTVINIVAGGAIFALVFSPMRPVGVWGMGNLAFDSLAQAVILGALLTVITGLVAGSQLRKGKVEAYQGRSILPRSLFLRALLVGVATGVVGAAAAAGLLYLIDRPELAWPSALTFKLVFSGLLALAVTPVAIRSALRA